MVAVERTSLGMLGAGTMLAVNCQWRVDIGELDLLVADVDGDFEVHIDDDGHVHVDAGAEREVGLRPRVVVAEAESAQKKWVVALEEHYISRKNKPGKKWATALANIGNDWWCAWVEKEALPMGTAQNYNFPNSIEARK